MLIKEQSQRQLQVAQEIKKIIAGLIERGEVFNLRTMRALVTITEVRISPDLKYAYVYFITSEVSQDKYGLKMLNLAANYFRKEVAKSTSLRYTPEMIFKLDESFAAVGKIETLLNTDKVKQDLEQ